MVRQILSDTGTLMTISGLGWLKYVHQVATGPSIMACGIEKTENIIRNKMTFFCFLRFVKEPDALTIGSVAQRGIVIGLGGQLFHELALALTMVDRIVALQTLIRHYHLPV
jgi:hypothetical protein